MITARTFRTHTSKIFSVYGYNLCDPCARFYYNRETMAYVLIASAQLYVKLSLTEHIVSLSFMWVFFFFFCLTRTTKTIYRFFSRLNARRDRRIFTGYNTPARTHRRRLVDGRKTQKKIRSFPFPSGRGCKKEICLLKNT